MKEPHGPTVRPDLPVSSCEACLIPRRAPMPPPSSRGVPEINTREIQDKLRDTRGGANQLKTTPEKTPHYANGSSGGHELGGERGALVEQAAVLLDTASDLDLGRRHRVHRSMIVATSSRLILPRPFLNEAAVARASSKGIIEKTRIGPAGSAVTYRSAATALRSI